MQQYKYHGLAREPSFLYLAAQVEVGAVQQTYAGAVVDCDSAAGYTLGCGWKRKATKRSGGGNRRTSMPLHGAYFCKGKMQTTQGIIGSYNNTKLSAMPVHVLLYLSFMAVWQIRFKFDVFLHRSISSN